MFSLRWRLVAVALGVASIGLIAANVVVYGVVRNDLNDRIDRQLLDFSGRRLLFRGIDETTGRGPFGGVVPVPVPVASTVPSNPPVSPSTTISTAGTAPPPDGPRRPPRAAFETYAEIRDASGRLIVGPQRFSASEDSAPDPLALPIVMGKPPARPKIFESSDAAGKPYRVIYRELQANRFSETTQGLVFAIPTVDRDATLFAPAGGPAIHGRRDFGRPRAVCFPTGSPRSPTPSAD